MQYTFQPVVDTSDSHVGFYFTMFAVILILVIAIHDYFTEWKGKPNGTLSYIGAVSPGAVILGFVVFFGYHFSYTPDHPLNKRVVGEFVGFQPEGYNERMGKSRADHHYMYIVYRVNGQLVVLQANEGVTYPPQAVLYMNKQ